MGRSTIRLGPFSGGLNNIAYGTASATNSNNDSIADNELIVCKDFEYLSDGSLISRPPITQEALVGDVAIDGNYMNIIGFFVDTNFVSYTLMQNAGRLWYRTGTSPLIGGTSAWTIAGVIPVAATAGIQYIDQFYIVCRSGAGYRWSPGGGLIAVASMPAGNSIQLFKERLWITGEAVAATYTRLHYSNVGTGSTWTGADFIDIDTGNGQPLVDCYAGSSALYLFKANSTYALTYDSLPARGLIQNISSTIGLGFRECYSVHDNTIYVLHGATAYRLDGYQYTRINAKVDMTILDSAVAMARPYSVSTVGDRIIFQYKRYNFVYYPIAGVWTEWRLTYSSKWYYIPSSLRSLGYKVYLTTQNEGYNPTVGELSVLQDEHILEEVEDEVAVYPELRTKLFSFGTPEEFKKLHWLGMDAIIKVGGAGDGNVGFKVYALNAAGSYLSDNDYVVSDTAADDNRVFFKGDGGVRFTRIQLGMRVTSSVVYNQGRISIQGFVLNISDKQSPVAISPT